jgi:hypothetical protein
LGQSRPLKKDGGESYLRERERERERESKNRAKFSCFGDFFEKYLSRNHTVKNNTFQVKLCQEKS